MNNIITSTLTVQKEKLSSSTGYSWYYQRNRANRKFSSMTSQRSCSCGNAQICQRKCVGYAAWMSGSKSLPSFATSFVLTSNKSFSVGVTVYGFTIMGNLRILQGDTICFYNGLKLISDIHHTLLSKKTSLLTWLLVKLTTVVSVSFILSAVVLATLTYALLSWWMKLVKLKRSFLAYSRKLVKTRKRTYS